MYVFKDLMESLRHISKREIIGPYMGSGYEVP